jgi:hypothetical protein
MAFTAGDRRRIAAEAPLDDAFREECARRGISLTRD